MQDVIRKSGKRVKRRYRDSSAGDASLLLKLYELVQGERGMIRVHSKVLDSDVYFVNPAVCDVAALQTDCPVYCTRELAQALSEEGLGDEEGTFDYSASAQGVLFSSSPTVEQLIEYLTKNYVGTGKTIEFEKLQIETYRLPFVGKHYRHAIKQMEKRKQDVKVKRIKSKSTGITKGDLIHFLRGY